MNSQEMCQERLDKILVIGAAGFVGGHLLSYLATMPGLQVAATKLPHEVINSEVFSLAEFFDLDIRNQDEIESLLLSFKPDAIIHLAAQSSVALSFQKPELTFQINLIGSLHLMEAALNICPSCRILMIGSSEQYGKVLPEQLPVKETQALAPVSPYAISKMAVENLAALYHQTRALPVIQVRAFNHIGPGQLPLFVVSDFAKQIAQIEKGQQVAEMRVGNLDALRDFTDVRDIVRGYVLLLQKGRLGEVYNIGSGKSVPVSQVLDTLLSYAKEKIEVIRDPAKFRPIDIPEIRADISKLQKDTGWSPEYSLASSLKDSLNYWRLNV